MSKKEIRQKTGTFGTAVVAHISPAAFLESAPRAMNVILSFEQALSLFCIPPFVRFLEIE